MGGIAERSEVGCCVAREAEAIYVARVAIVGTGKAGFDGAIFEEASQAAQEA